MILEPGCCAGSVRQRIAALTALSISLHHDGGVLPDSEVKNGVLYVRCSPPMRGQIAKLEGFCGQTGIVLSAMQAPTIKSGLLDNGLNFSPLGPPKWMSPKMCCEPKHICESTEKSTF